MNKWYKIYFNHIDGISFHTVLEDLKQSFVINRETACAQKLYALSYVLRKIPIYC